MILLYLASTLYHSVNSTVKVNRRLKKMDHMMIFVMIAGSYTPVCLIVLHGRTGYILCALVWTVAIIGMILKGCWINCPKWLSSVIYIGMGWLCVLAFVPIFHNLPRAGFGWLLAGGIIYTIGGVIYALKLPIFNAKHKNFGSHEVFHVFVMLGSVCHFVVMYFFVAGMAIH
jgi:hemolysin III